MKKDTVGSMFLLLFSIYFAIESYRQDLGELHMPGPGFFPFVSAVAFGLLATFVLMKSMKRTSANDKDETFEEQGHLRYANLLLIVGAMVGYVVMINSIGFVICTFVFVLFLIRIIAKQGWSASLIISGCVTLVCHLVFNVSLNAQLPKGLL